MLALFLFTGLSVKAQAELGLQVSAAPTTTEGVTVWSEGTKWYKLKMDSGSWRYVETSGSYTNASGKLILTNGTSSNLFTGAWAVVGDDTNGYRFYNMGEGPSKVLGVTGSDGGARTSMVDAATPGDGVTTTFKIVKHTDGKWYIKKHGDNTEYINNRDYYVALWNSSAALGNSGSSFMFEAIEDVSAYATAAQSKLVSRVGMWKKVPAVWAEASAAYDALNAVTLSATVTNAELVTAAAAQKTAGSTFVNAVNNQRVTLSNCSASPAQRVNSFMYYDTASNTVKGRNATTQNTNLTLDEVFTLKPCNDITLKIYSATANKYLGTPGGERTNGVNEVANPGAAGFDIHTADDFADNRVVFCVNGTATMHLLGGLNVTNHSSKTDQGSIWLLNTDVSRHELQTAINNATTFKTNLETLMNNLLTAGQINVKFGTLSVTLPTAITKAQNALNDAGGTPATRNAATAALNATLTKAKGAWLAELGTTQQFRLKSRTITNYYLTANQKVAYTGEGVLRLFTAPEVGADNYETVLANQTFTLVPGTGADAGKYILQSNGKQIKTGNVQNWNASMSDAGSPYTFEFTDLANALVRVKTANGYVGPNANVTTTNVETVYNNEKNPNDQKNGHKTNSFVYINHGSNNGNIVWELEFIAPTPGAVNKTSLQATLNSQKFIVDYASNILNETSIPCVVAYGSYKQKAQKVIDGTTGSTVTQLDVNTAEAELKAAYEQVLNNFISEADPSQGYRLVYYHPTNYTAKDLYLTFNSDYTETHAVNALQLKQRSAASMQSVELVSAGSYNSFYIAEGFNNGQVGQSTTYFWNPTIVTNGVAYTFEYVTLEGIDGIVVRLKNPQGYLGCDLGSSHAAVAENDYLYTNNSGNNYWIVQPCVSPDLVITLYNKIFEAKAYEPYVGTGVGKYSTAAGMDADALAYNNSLYLDFINETGSYEGKEKTNIGVQSAINDVYDTMVFPITINQPEVGKLYRIKGKKSKKYMASSSTRNKMVLNEEAANGLETVFKLVEDGGNYKLLNCGNGYFITNTHDASALKANANTITFNASESSYIGYYTIKTNYSSPYIYDDKTDNEVDRNSTYAADYCDWQIEEVTWLPVPINTTVGFGTLYSPVPLKGVSSGNYNQDGRLEFYYGVKVNEAGVNKLKLTKLEGDIPAETGLIVKYKDGIQSTGCVYMEIADTDPEFTADNALTGTLETVATPTPGTVYTLQKPADSPLGFYNFTGANVKGGKAYLHVVDSEAPPMGLVFDFGGETTGVESIEVNTDNQVIYDLSGRRVAKAGKGLYIINGKKVLVK